MNTNNFTFVSIGENCLTDNILDRHGLKSFSSPYSHGKSNIDYILALEACNYKVLLDEQYLAYEASGEKKVVRNTSLRKCDDIYLKDLMNGFEFTHHDVIAGRDERASYTRKVKRMLELRTKENVIFFYHHRICGKTDYGKLFHKLEQFIACYRTSCFIIVFAQKIVSNPHDRKVVYKQAAKNMHFFEFHTTAIWGGLNREIFWAKVDDDLIIEMINKVKEIALNRNNRLKVILNNWKWALLGHKEQTIVVNVNA